MARVGKGLAIGIMAFTFALCGAGDSRAAQGDCSQPATNGSSPTATDCLFILQAAVGSQTCSPECICAPKGSLPTTATDALLCLNFAVGGAVTLNCPCSGGGGGEYQAESATFLSEIELPELIVIETDEGQEADVVCCKDFGERSRDFIESGTNNIDNQFRVLAYFLDQFSGGDINSSTNGKIESGDLVVLFDHRGVNEMSFPDDFQLGVLSGDFAPGTDYPAASTGSGEFLIDPESLSGDNSPAVLFETASFDETTLTASGGTFQATVPFGGRLVEVAISEAEIFGSHTGITEDGLGYEEGTISGYIFPPALIEATNDVLLGDSCACLGLTEPPYVETEEGWMGPGCVADAESLCPNESQRSCVVLGETFDLDDEEAIGLCDLVPEAMFALSDINLDEDPETFEALSAGLIFRGAPGSISGIVE